MKVVLDASVILKWLLADPENERFTERATALMQSVIADVDVWQRACTLATETREHLFDTLYHAVALTSDDAALVTADDRYCTKAYG